jgi:hypothetical protein
MAADYPIGRSQIVKLTVPMHRMIDAGLLDAVAMFLVGFGHRDDDEALHGRPEQLFELLDTHLCCGSHQRLSFIPACCSRRRRRSSISTFTGIIRAPDGLLSQPFRECAFL